MPTTTRGFRYPASSAAPNVAQDIQNLATDVDAAISAGAWVTQYATATTYNSAVPATTFTTLSGFSSFTTPVIPSGRTLDVEWSAPLVDTPTGTGLQVRIVIGGVSRNAVYYSNSNTNSYALPGFCKATFTGTGATTTVVVEVLRNGGGASNPSIQGASLAPVYLKYRIS